MIEKITVVINERNIDIYIGDIISILKRSSFPHSSREWFDILGGGYAYIRRDVVVVRLRNCKGECKGCFNKFIINDEICLDDVITLAKHSSYMKKTIKPLLEYVI